MNHIVHFLNKLFRPRGQIIISLLLFSEIIIAQETPPTGEFPVGTQIGADHFMNPEMRDTLAAVGLNTLYNFAYDDRKTYLEDYNLIPQNDSSEYDRIYHYTTSFYSKWEAEENQTEEARVGVKHKAGTQAYWYDPELNENILCWSTEGLSAPACSLMYGPHYRQEKKYKRWGHPIVNYVVRFNMALSNPQNVPGNEDVCKIKVVFRYKDMRDSLHYDVPFISRILKISDFNTDSSFKYIYFDENPNLRWYEYPDSLREPAKLDQIIEPPAGTFSYVDYESYTGIQYWVEWLRNDNKCNLYIDYVELYDNDGWNEYIGNPTQTSYFIKSYADSFKTMGWNNIIYWSGVDEPSNIDTYTPVHIVDSLIRSYPVLAPPVGTVFNATWTADHKVNGEDQMVQYFNMAKPTKLHYSCNPCTQWNPVLTFDEVEWFRFNLQRASALDSNFWYNAQTHGLKTGINDTTWCVWRKPKPAELRSLVNLALAHGAKGIVFLWFDTFINEQNNSECDYWEAMVDTEAHPLDLYWEVKDNLVPRLKGKLGKTLLELDYIIE
jgi:hypothetical protein